MNVRHGITGALALLLTAAAQAAGLDHVSKLFDSRCAETEVVEQELTACLSAMSSDPVPASACFNQYVKSRVNRSMGRREAQAVYGSVDDKTVKLTPAYGEAVELLHNVVAGSPTPALLGTVDSFLPKLLPTVLQSFGELEEPQTLGTTWVPFEIGWIKARVGGFATPDPKVNPVLEAALIQRGQLESLTSRGDTDLGDDYFVAADITIEGPWFGQDMEDHGKEHAHLAYIALTGQDEKGSSPATLYYDDYREITRQKDWAKPGSETLKGASCALMVHTDLVSDGQKALRDTRVSEFWRLVHNQPQLTFTARQLKREDTVGASAFSWRVKLSSGLFNNVNWLRWFCEPGLAGDDCAQSYRKVLEGVPSRSGLGASFYYEAGRLDDLEFILPPLAAGEEPPLLPIPGFPTLNPAATGATDRLSIPGGGFTRHGWSLGFSLKDPQAGEKLKESLRIDGGIDYYRYKHDRLADEGDVARLDHEVTRITLTYRRGPLSIPLHLMYRTKTEFTVSPTDDVVLGIGAQGNLF